MTKLAFCDYHNMVSLLEKTEHNIDFHQIVDFLRMLKRGEKNLFDAKRIQSQDLEITYTDKGSESTDEMANVLSTLGAANVLSSGGKASIPAGVATASESFPTAGVVPTSISVPKISAKGKRNEKMVEMRNKKEEGLQEQLDGQMARELELEFAQEAQLIKEQGKKDATIARAQAEREVGIMIDKLDRNNEVIINHMNKYEQAEAGLSLEEKIEIINELIKYQRNLAEVKKYQAQQSKSETKAKKRSFYMSILKSNDGLKDKNFRGMYFKQIEENFIPVWKQMQDFVPMNSKIESSEPSQKQQAEDTKELSKEELKKMIEIVPIKEVYIEALQRKYPIIDWEIYAEEQRRYWKIIRVGNHTKVYQTFEEMLKKCDREDQDRLWSLVKETFSSTNPTGDK
ncbi:hypothetical protein Tco_1231700 [Tanacetum coccineum]